MGCGLEMVWRICGCASKALAVVERQTFHRILASPEINRSYRRAAKLLLGNTYHRSPHCRGLELGGRV
jgi:hypothetical protein